MPLFPPVRSLAGLKRCPDYPCPTANLVPVAEIALGHSQGQHDCFLSKGKCALVEHATEDAVLVWVDRLKNRDDVLRFLRLGLAPERLAGKKLVARVAALCNASERWVTSLKHELLHRLKRFSRFLSNDQVDPDEVLVACIPTILAHLGQPRWLGLLIDWTSFDVTLPGLVGGSARKYQVLTIAVPRCGRTIPLLSVTCERGKIPATGSQNRWEEEALALDAAIADALGQITHVDACGFFTHYDHLTLDSSAR